MNPRERLRIAVQKSGRLSEPAFDLLDRCGLRFRRSRDGLFCFGEGEPIDLLLVRDDDIPGLIAQGVCELGIVGRNVLDEFSRGTDAGPELQAMRGLGFGHCRLAIAVPQERAYDGPASLAGLRLATSYPNLLRDWLRRHAVQADVVTLAGSVEIAPRLGTADAICDLVQSGATLLANQLREVDRVLDSEAVLVRAAQLPADGRADVVELLLRRIEGVTRVRGSRLLLLQAARDCVEAVIAALPGSPRPTVLQMDGQPGQVMLQALCPDELGWRQLEEIQRAGARELFVLPVERALA
ncbi:MAG: ATP phosphoribosyltransferase [Xanthomonadales bacterium]|nr:ATP phosphoribosyltransferase [Xanthomonadales bacterium]ODU93580.1 MAG: ATP phosphoribosyltransferase [Rhodanobacter sp. SCN 66-43]OJY86677.1 MAG: ATP phosphoribosyltransferase [Xanthomonadales bacterium 66-474]